MKRMGGRWSLSNWEVDRTMSTTLKRVPGEVGADHDEMLAWADIHSKRVRGEFIRWLLKSRFQVAAPEDPAASTVGKYPPLELFMKHLADDGFYTRNEPEDILARRFTRRVLCHLLKGVRFVRKPV